MEVDDEDFGFDAELDIEQEDIKKLVEDKLEVLYLAPLKGTVEGRKTQIWKDYGARHHHHHCHAPNVSINLQ